MRAVPATRTSSAAVLMELPPRRDLNSRAATAASLNAMALNATALLVRTDAALMDVM